MSKIKTWNERCEEHPDHQTGMVSNSMIQARMQEEIDELRAALAEPVQEPQGCAHCNHPLYAAVKCKVCGRVTEPTPPQRKPLSEVDLRALYDRHAACQEEGPEISGWWDFARAIERAHGVGGEG